MSLQDPGIQKNSFHIQIELSTISFIVTVGTPSFSLYLPWQETGQFSYFHLQQLIPPNKPGNPYSRDCFKIRIISTSVEFLKY